MKKILNLVIIMSFLFWGASVLAGSAYAQTFRFELADPAQTISVGSNFQVKVFINLGSESVINGDALVSFDNTKLSVGTALSGNFFTYFAANPLGGASNKYLLSSWEESVSNAKSGTGDNLFATLGFTALSGGTTNLTFDCTPGTEADSNINRASDSKDIINCSLLRPLAITIGGSGSITPGPTTNPSVAPTSGPTTNPSVAPTSGPTSAPVVATSTPVPTTSGGSYSTPEPTAVELPRAGNSNITFFAMGLSALLTIFGVLAIF